jgi:ATP-dependent Lhr-like helicase
MSNGKLLERQVAAAFYGRFSSLRPAQDAAIPPIVSGQNVVLSSGTGSGKTEAVVAPLLSRYWRQAVESDALTILYIAPTKALANDLAKRLHAPLEALGLLVGVRHGDRDDLASGKTPHFLLTTPESLEVMLFRKDKALASIRALVIDEVHLLYNSQRGLQLSCLIRRLRTQLANLQWAALSATVGRLSDVRDFLFGNAEPATFLEFPAHRSIDAQVRYCPDESTFLSLIRKLTSGRPTKLLVFANARKECERLAGVLSHDRELRPNVVAHYSSLSPEVRVETEEQFASARTAVCVATSTLELGIDIGDIDAVILWGVPSGVESFLQRIGRGNRRSLKTNVICIIPDDTTSVPLTCLRFLALIDAARKGEMSVRAPYELFGAVAQQCLSVVASENGKFTRIAELCRHFEHLSHLQRDVVEAVLAELGSKDYLQRHGFKNQFGAADRLYELVDYKLIYGNFPLGSQSLEVHHGSQVLGTVPAVNLLRLTKGGTVRFAGKRWRIREASTDGISVEPTQARGHAVDFIYPGTGIGFDAFLTSRMWQLLHASDIPLDCLAPNLKKPMAEVVQTFRTACRSDQIPFYRTHTGIRYFTFGGYLVNKAIALSTGQPDFKADDFFLDVVTPIDWSKLITKPQDFEAVFHSLFEANSAQSLYQTFLPVDLQRIEFLQEWLKNEAVGRVLTRLKHASPVRLDMPKAPQQVGLLPAT